METAKVDIRKLQLLNDRINQCIDALNQVRLSVHGLSHASAVPYGAIPLAGGYIPGIPQAAQTAGALGAFGATGVVPGQVPLTGAFNPLGLSHATFEGVEGRPVWADPLMAAGRPFYADPVLATRIAQTFPYVFLPVSPGGTIY